MRGFMLAVAAAVVVGMVHGASSAAGERIDAVKLGLSPERSGFWYNMGVRR